MRQVVYALSPAIVVYVFLFGFGILVHLVVAIGAALLFEAFALRLRGLQAKRFLEDGSVVVLGVLLVLAIPPYAPWWITVVGVGFAVLIGKHAFGGIGQNVFNPAMVGYIFLLLCFPLTLSRWPELGRLIGFPSPWDSVKLVFAGSASDLDGISGATALDHVKTQAALMRMLSEMQADAAFGHIAGRGWEWVSAAYLVGGGWLLWRRVITWRLPLSYLAGLAAAALVGYVIDPELHRGAAFHLFAGGAMLAAFFVVTDPVSSATTPRGMLIFGVGAGLLTVIIRESGTYPDGVAFAVVIMNSFAPLIDRFTQPRLYGQTSETDNSSSTTLR
jgi:electron transport complex protein RnfD